MLTKPVTRTFHVERGGSKRKHLGLVLFALIAFGVGSLALLSVPGSRASVGVESHVGTTVGPTIPNRSLPPEGTPRLRRYNVLDQERFRWEGLSSLDALIVDGKEAHAIPLLMPPDETFDIGLDTRTPADFTYDVPCRFTGTIDKLNYKPGPEQLSAKDKKTAAIKLARAKD
jgi:hypothetical protein